MMQRVRIYMLFALTQTMKASTFLFQLPAGPMTFATQRADWTRMNILGSDIHLMFSTVGQLSAKLRNWMPE